MVNSCFYACPYVHAPSVWLSVCLFLCKSCFVLKCLNVNRWSSLVANHGNFHLLKTCIFTVIRAEQFDESGRQPTLWQLLKHCFRYNSADSCASCISFDTSCLATHEEAKIWKVHHFMVLTTVRKNLLTQIYVKMVVMWQWIFIHLVHSDTATAKLKMLTIHLQAFGFI